ncbi:MAG: hypothetical protein JWP91_2975 [Fibrobacteres bacterium]|nr:hypothetical protein [Fibrobacterota bacterium]
MIAWILALAGGLAGLAVGGYLLWRKNLTPGGQAAMDIAMVQRLTDKFPAIMRTSPDPAIKPEKRTAGLQGNLAQTPLYDLLQYLSLGHKSGILELVSGRRTGRIVLKDGRVYKNSYRGKDGMDAMFMMMDLVEGDFEFYEQTLEDSVSFSGLEVVDIIMLWMDRKPKKKA